MKQSDDRETLMLVQSMLIVFESHIREVNQILKNIVESDEEEKRPIRPVNQNRDV